MPWSSSKQLIEHTSICLLPVLCRLSVNWLERGFDNKADDSLNQQPLNKVNPVDSSSIFRKPSPCIPSSVGNSSQTKCARVFTVSNVAYWGPSFCPSSKVHQAFKALVRALPAWPAWLSPGIKNSSCSQGYGLF